MLSGMRKVIPILISLTLILMAVHSLSRVVQGDVWPGYSTSSNALVAPAAVFWAVAALSVFVWRRRAPVLVFIAGLTALFHGILTRIGESAEAMTQVGSVYIFGSTLVLGFVIALQHASGKYLITVVDESPSYPNSRDSDRYRDSA